MLLTPMRYKQYVWPHNPEVYEVERQRRLVVHPVPFGGCVVQDLGQGCRVLRGRGTFAGPEAYEQFKKLLVLAENGTAGNLEHPVWGIRYCYFTSLEMTQEPEAECVHYRFQFTGALENGTVPK